jgi:hypothetical protein
MYLEKAVLGDLYCRLVCLFTKVATYSLFVPTNEL